MSEQREPETPRWVIAVIVVVILAGVAVTLPVVLLGLLTASAPDCSAATASGKLAHRIAGAVTLLGVVGIWVAAMLTMTRAEAVLRQLVLAALPLAFVPLLVLGTSGALSAAMHAIGDDGRSSCF